jgi:hypothetical protein
MEMSQIAIIASEDVLLTELTHLTNGKIEAAVACFADEFTFNDHGIGLEFNDKERCCRQMRSQNRSLHS